MNVKQLKKILENYDEDAIVIVSNNETSENHIIGENDFSDSKEYFEICIDEDNLC